MHFDWEQIFIHIFQLKNFDAYEHFYDSEITMNHICISAR